MQVDREMEQFWRGKHEAEDAMYLSGNGGKVLDRLWVRGMFPSVQALLNVGVGLGVFERYVRPMVERMDCLDITDAAQAAVEGIVDHFYLRPAELPEGVYDLVTELLVAQHLSDGELQEHLIWGIRALKVDGLLALQTADFLRPPTEDMLAKNYTVAAQKAGSVKRRVPWVVDMIEACGGEVVNILHGPKFPEYESEWVVYHVKRAI